MCPNLSFPKTAVQDRVNMPGGIYEVMLTGFAQDLSKKKDGKEQTVNLNPILIVVNSIGTFPDGKPYNGTRVYDALNIQFNQRILDFFHCFNDKEGCWETETDHGIVDRWAGGATTPDPKTWGPYVGPCINAVGKIELVEVPQSKQVGDKWVPDPTRTRNDIKRYFCAVPQCAEKHSESLLRL